MRLPRRLAAAAVLLAALAAGRDALGLTAPPPVQTVRLTIHHSRFTPAEVAVEPGTTVRFEVVNTDPIAHELVVGPAEVQHGHEVGTDEHHDGTRGAVSVPAGGTRTTAYAFTAPAGVLLGCHLPGHWDYGMRGVVTSR